MEEKNDVVLKENNTPALLGFIFSLTVCLYFPGLILSIIGLATAKNYKNNRRGFAIAGLIISGILLLISIGMYSNGTIGGNKNTSGSNNTNNSIVKKQESKKIEYTKVDIDTMEEALDNNAAAAKDTYNGKYLEITGRLGTIDSDLKYISLLSPTDEWDIIGIHCTLKNQQVKDAVKTLTKDQNIIVKGRITDVGEVLGYYLDVDEIIAQ